MTGFPIRYEILTFRIGLKNSYFFKSFGLFENKEFKLIAREPACIGFGDDDRILIGQQALTQNRSFFNLKRFLSNDDISAVTFKKHTKYLPFDLIRTKNNSYLIELDIVHSVSPEYLLAKILKKTIAQLPDSIGKLDLEAVVAVSSNLSSSRINSLRNVFKLANIKLNKLVSNIEAISLAHFYTMKHSTRYNDKKLALVYDLGSGMFEVSLMHISRHDMDYITYKLYSSRSDHNLGSIDFKDRIIEFSIKEFYIETQISLRKNKRALSLIRQASIKAFYELVETKSQVRIKIEKILVNPDFDLDTTLTYEHFQIVCEDLFRDSRILVGSLFEGTEFSKRDVDEVILVGHASSLLIEPSEFKVERIDFKVERVLGVALEAAFKTGSYKNKIKFVFLNYTKGESNGERKSEKIKTFEDKIINEPYNEPYNEPLNEPFVGRMCKIKKTFEDEPYNELYNLASSYLVYNFKVILAVVLGIVVLFVVLPASLGYRSKSPINTDESQRQRPQTVTLNIGNSSNKYVAQRQAPSARNWLNQTGSETSYTENIGNSSNNYVALREAPSARNRLNQTASETSYTGNIVNHLANLRGMMNGWNNMYMVKAN